MALLKTPSVWVYTLWAYNVKAYLRGEFPVRLMRVSLVHVHMLVQRVRCGPREGRANMCVMCVLIHAYSEFSVFTIKRSQARHLPSCGRNWGGLHVTIRVRFYLDRLLVCDSDVRECICEGCWGGGCCCCCCSCRQHTQNETAKLDEIPTTRHNILAKTPQKTHITRSSVVAGTLTLISHHTNRIITDTNRVV